MPDLVHRHRLQIHRRERRPAEKIPVHHPALVAVQVAPPRRRRERYPVERLPVTVLPREKPDPDVRPAAGRRLDERQRGNLRPPFESPGEDRPDLVRQPVRRIEGVSQLAPAGGPPRPVWEEGVVGHRGVGGASAAAAHGGGAVDDVGVSASGLMATAWLFMKSSLNQGA
ncbi:biotin synthase [Striga asiatica]|uniref:Biotin synthase n=1 Tax=Striga asiatica TaxID=4170 RepID=A0A5A7RFL5_STRAF|nr:biotin synthase [Striga asiatica]